MQSTGGKNDECINLFEIPRGDDVCAFVVQVRYPLTSKFPVQRLVLVVVDGIQARQQPVDCPWLK